MFSANNHLPAYLLHPDKRGHSYSPKNTPITQCMQFQGNLFEWLGQEVRVGDLRDGLNGVSSTATSSEDHMAEARTKNRIAFRNGYPGAYGTFLFEATNGKNEEELIERPEVLIHRLAMIGQGAEHMKAEYEGKKQEKT